MKHMLKKLSHGLLYTVLLSKDILTSILHSDFIITQVLIGSCLALLSLATGEPNVAYLSATFDTANLTVARNGKKIQGDASDMTVATERAGFALVFSGDTQGWLLMEK